MNESTQRKTMALIRLFSCYPAMDRQSPEQASDTMTAYLTTLADCEPTDVEQACAQLMKANNPFVPSAGQVYTAAERFAAKRFEQEKLRRESLPKPSRPQRSPDELDRNKQRYDSVMAELLSHSEADGYIPSGRTNPVAERRRASEWLERHGPGSNHEVKKVINISPDLEASLRRTFPQNFEAAE